MCDILQCSVAFVPEITKRTCHGAYCAQQNDAIALFRVLERGKSAISGRNHPSMLLTNLSHYSHLIREYQEM